MSAPSFQLPPCPVCSSLVALVRPFWKLARSTTAARKRSCYMWMGCAHALGVVDGAKIRDDPDDWGFCEDAWTEEARQLFAARTEGWTPHAVSGFRRALDDRAFLPGATEAIKFSEPDPRPNETQTSRQ